MNPAWIIAVVGTFVVSILIPVTLLVVFQFTPLKTKPGIAYGIPGALAVLTPFATLAIGGHATKAVIAAVLAAALFGWGYMRAAKKQATQSSAPDAEA